MEGDKYLFFIPKGNVHPLQDKFRELGGFYNELGYAFPSKSESFLKELVANLPNANIHKLPLGIGQSFESFQQAYKAAYFQEQLIKIENQILSFKNQNKLDDISEEGIASASISDDQKQAALELIQKKERLARSLDWAVGLEKALSSEKKNKVDLKFISELSPDYFIKQPQDKPRLLYYVEADGTKKTFLHKEITAMLVAAGGAGKTHALALLALCVASGIPWFGKIEIEKPGNVCFIAGENDPSDIHRLLYKTRKHLQKMLEENQNAPEAKRFGLFGKEPLKHIDSRICPMSVHGKAAGLINADGTVTPFYEDLLAELKEKEPADGWQLIILDPASRFAGPDAEKDNAVATAFIACLERISEALNGRPAILMSHHKSKVAVRDGGGTQADARGSSALTDGVRWQANFDNIEGEENCFKFYIAKTNFTAHPKAIKIRKELDGMPEFVEWLESGKNKKEQDSVGNKSNKNGRLKTSGLTKA